MLDSLRYHEEKEIFSTLWELLSADIILELMGKSNPYKPESREHNLTPVTKSLPWLRNMIDNVLERFEMQQWGITFFLTNTDEPFAKSQLEIYQACEVTEIIISTGLTELLNKDELKAVLAHELAHIWFGHHRLTLAFQWFNGAHKEGRLYALTNLYTYWRKLAEISADRASLFVVDDSNNVITSLARQNLKTLASDLNIDMFLEEQRKFFTSKELHYCHNESHPPWELRALAIDFFRKTAPFTGSQSHESIAKNEIQAEQITTLVDRLKVLPKNENQYLEFAFLLAAGNYLIHADGVAHINEITRLRDILARLLHDPDTHLFAETDIYESRRMMSELGNLLITSYPGSGEKTYSLLCSLIIQDNRITQTEKSALEDIASALQIPAAKAAQILLNTLRNEFRPEMK